MGCRELIRVIFSLCSYHRFTNPKNAWTSSNGFFKTQREVLEQVVRIGFVKTLHQIKPVIVQVFPLDEAPSAYRYV
ncbi:MAG: hypothetical protein HC903_29670 [Methylacidiphilales bacterium]|nr:hypothetical protein [Candidatus Methylacidiphilales bacterium]NJR17926.1 hypothetical protein [Calothrix sp. CSU_2_0]